MQSGRQDVGARTNLRSDVHCPIPRGFSLQRKVLLFDPGFPQVFVVQPERCVDGNLQVYTVSCGYTSRGTTRWSGPRKRSFACGRCGMKDTRPPRSAGGLAFRRMRLSARRTGSICRPDPRRSVATERERSPRPRSTPRRVAGPTLPPLSSTGMVTASGPAMVAILCLRHRGRHRCRHRRAPSRLRRDPMAGWSPVAGRSANRARGASASAMPNRSRESLTARIMRNWPT